MPDSDDLNYGHLRGAPRDSLFLQAELRGPDGASLGNARIRNISATGMMAETAAALQPQDVIQLDLRGVGTISATISWAQDGKIGAHFEHAIDPIAVRRPVSVRSTPVQDINARFRRPNFG